MRGLALAATIAVLSVASPCLGQIQPDPTDLDLDGIPGVRVMPANPQPQIPSVLVGTGRLLIDRSHRGNFDVGGFTSFLSSEGWVIAEHPSGPITSAVLAGYDILLTPIRFTADAMDLYSTSEVDAIQTFLRDGGGLWMPHDNRDPASFNSLAQAFGITFKYDFIQDPTDNEGRTFWPRIHLLEPHPITAGGIGSYGFYGGDCIEVSTPAEILGRADDDAYSLYCPVGSRPPTLAVWDRAGRAVFSGDTTPLHPSYYPSLLRPEEQLLLQNIANWLLGDSPTSISPATWGGVKSIYAPYENPGKEFRQAPQP